MRHVRGDIFGEAAFPVVSVLSAVSVGVSRLHWRSARHNHGAGGGSTSLTQGAGEQVHRLNDGGPRAADRRKQQRRSQLELYNLPSRHPDPSGNRDQDEGGRLLPAEKIVGVAVAFEDSCMADVHPGGGSAAPLQKH